MCKIVDLNERYRRIQCLGQVCSFEGSHRTETWTFPLQTGKTELKEAGVNIEVSQHNGQWKLNLTCVEDKGIFCSLGFRFLIDNWSDKHYLLAPAAVYDGNRFPVMRIGYPPIIPLELEDSQPPLITTADIPGLAKGKTIKLRAGDMSMPLLAMYDHGHHMAWFVQTDAFSADFESGFMVGEDIEQAILTGEVSVPFVKEDTTYYFPKLTTQAPSDDTGVNLHLGDTLEIVTRIDELPCEDLPGLFEEVFSRADDLRQGEEHTNPVHCFSRIMEVIQKDLDTERWNEEYGYYSNAFRFGKKTCVLGWPGNSALAVLLGGISESIDHATRSVRYIINHLQAPSGFFYGMVAEGVPYGDHFFAREKEWFLLSRRNTDEMIFLERLLDSLPDEEDRKALEATLRRCADAWVRFAARYSQLGQFIDLREEKQILSGSSSAASGIGALAILGSRWNEKRYLDCALALGETYYQEYAGKGLSFGGPGEIMNANDSESSYGQVIAYTKLYEAAKDPKWLERALHAAKLFATWCIRYQYPFAKDSTFGRMGMQSSGAVFANAQNKHGAPGICTHSGIELLNLYRYSGDERLLRLIRDIAASIPQYVSMPERPIPCIDGQIEPYGQICERVSTSDWEGKERRGEIFGACAWPSNAAMATFIELPGVYVCPDRNVCCTLDAVTAQIDECDEDGVWLEMKNLSGIPANVTVWAELDAQIEPNPLAIPCKDYTKIRFANNQKERIYISYAKCH